MNRIRELREQRNLKQVELAKAINVRQNTLSTWETGRYEPDLEMLTRLANYFDVSVDYLLGRESKDPLKRWAAKQKEEAATQESDGPADDDARLLRLLTKADPDLKKAMIEFLEKAQK